MNQDRFSLKYFSKESLSSWQFVLNVFFVLQTILSMSGSDTAHSKKACSLSRVPIAPPSIFTDLLFCLWALSILIAEKIHSVSFNVKWPFTNSSAAETGRRCMSHRKMQPHLR